MEKRQAIIIAGMHRSGTSALTRVMNLLGADLPSRLLDPVKGVNDKGFWEPAEIAEAHDAFLHAQGSRWDDPSPLPPQAFTSEAAETCRGIVLRVLERDLAGSERFVIKDPRVCRLLPLWEGIPEAVGAEPFVVVTVRHPLEVAGSLARRDGFPTAKSLLLWLRHVLDAECHSRGRRRAFVSYDALLADWPAVMFRVHETLGLPWREPDEATRAAIDEFLSGDLRHHALDAALLRNGPEGHEWVADVYEALCAAAEGGAIDTGLLDRVHRELDHADRLFGPVAAWLDAGWRETGRKLDVSDMLLADVRRQLDEYKAELAKATERARATEIDRDRMHERLIAQIKWLEGEQASLQSQLARIRRNPLGRAAVLMLRLRERA